jgi:branched-chain amino acid transport system ATP-binding protein
MKPYFRSTTPIWDVSYNGDDKMVIRTQGLTRLFGGLSAVENVDFELGDDELCAIIGPNGAGKTTFFDLITGELRPTSGKVELRENGGWTDITSMSVDEVASRGVHRSYQITNLFPSNTVLENVRIATQKRDSTNFWRSVASFKSHRDRAMEVLEFVGLDDYASMDAEELSHAQKRRLEMGVALAGDPELLLLDEPTAGVSSEEVDEVTALIQKIAEDNHVMFIEHNMDIVMDISDRVVVFNRGSVIADGTPDEVEGDEDVQEAYLGSYTRGSSSTRSDEAGRRGSSGTP